MRDSFGGGRSLEKKELISRQRRSGSNLGRDPPLPCDTLSAPTLMVKSGLCPGTWNDSWNSSVFKIFIPPRRDRFT